MKIGTGAIQAPPQAPVLKPMQTLPQRLRTRQMTEKLDLLVHNTRINGSYGTKAAEFLGPDVRQLVLNKLETTKTKKKLPEITNDLYKDFMAHSRYRHAVTQSAKPSHRKTLKNGNPVSPGQLEAYHRTNRELDAYDAICSLLRGIAKMEASKVELDIAMEKNTHFRDFEISQTWRLFMDEVDQKPLGEYRYENESGYMAGMMSGYAHMLGHLQEPLSAESFVRDHDICVDGVLKLGESERLALKARDRGVIDPTTDSFMAKGYRDGTDNHFALVNGLNASDKGVRELLALSEAHGDFSVRRDGQHYILVTEKRSSAQCKAIATRIIETYNHEMRATRTHDQKLVAIARCCRDLEANHLFMDGNARTVGFVLVNKLLMQNGLPPAAMSTPSIFDGCSVVEAADKIAQGQRRFASMRK